MTATAYQIATASIPDPTAGVKLSGCQEAAKDSVISKDAAVTTTIAGKAIGGATVNYEPFDGTVPGSN